jgi:hypothetical protein
MARGGLRFSEEMYKAHMAKSDRFKVGTDQRPPDHSSRPLLPARGAPSKYRNKPTDGYASIKESKRAFQLKLMQEAGQIRNLREQVSFLLIPKQEGERACSYVADFVYEEWSFSHGVSRNKEWLPVVEDVKSPASRTDAYIIKRKLMRFVHGVTIRET